MNKPITNDEAIQLHQERLIHLRNEMEREVKIINLLTATALVAQDTAIKKLRTPSKESQRRVKGKRNVRRKERLPWRPSKNASPFVQTLYDTLEDGKVRTTDELYAQVVRKGFEVTEKQVRSALSWMKRSDRLTESKGKWRRKHARHARKNEPISSDKIIGKNADKVMGRYDRDVARGFRTKTIREDGVIEWSALNENTTAPSTEVSQ